MAKVVIKWLLLFIPCMISMVFGKAIAPILALFVNEYGWLPKWLSWFNTPHSTCDGDEYFKKRWPGNSRFQTWWRRTAWLFRNTAYNFNINVLGVKLVPTDKRIVVGNPEISDMNGVSGYCYRKAVDKDGNPKAFQHYYIKHWSNSVFSGCFRVSIGWKLWGNWEGTDHNAQYTCYFNPAIHLRLTKKQK